MDIVENLQKILKLRFVKKMQVEGNIVSASKGKIEMSSESDLKGRHEMDGKDNKLIIVVFYGVSCLGKTTFTRMIREHCGKNRITMKCTSIDIVATPVIKKYKEEHPEVTDREKIWFDNCQEITALFHQRILELVKSSAKGRNLLVIDEARIDANLLKKISTPGLIESHSVEVIALYPKNSEKFEFSSNRFIPFSSTLMLNLCHRSLNRDGHETMNYSDAKTLQIVLSFTLLYEGTQDFVTSFKKEARYSRMIEVPFLSDASQQLKNPHVFEKFVDLLEKAYQSIKAPFEYLKESDPTDLENLAGFLRSEENIKELGGYLSYGDKREWLGIFDWVCKGFDTGAALDKENDFNWINQLTSI